ncbi:hypothetical protein PSU4_14070 [Pseudonocardia sulfidoxydans NBRC 16205]|uniref:Phosphatidic acid phosphatase type 2/haloperoxidase domain-containing protein n=2 Tax=Pseudonocardia sulfidoxydans TaxID=54011 RepID=A0A511DDK9_9PSEU|nr:phosphatase PAP2 family protein [Pseudonocardia sulfidoxydans]GEL22453.1 hypothetical protein PSU4_14070 [Pseudonocardia sulfidoxydans NBRC 16205]
MLVLVAQDGAAVVAVVAAVALLLVGHRLAVHTGIVAVLVAAHAALSSVVVVVGHLGPVGPDRAVADELVRLRSSAATGILTVVGTVGDTVGMAVLAAVVGALLLWRRRVGDAVVMIGAVAGAGLLIVGLKQAVARPRPPEALRLAVETTYSFPSGHALSSVVVLGTAAAIVVRLGWRPALSGVAVTVASGAVAIIGFSRVYLGVHWPTDVLDGWLTGGVWLTVCLAALSELDRRRGRPAQAQRGDLTPRDAVTGGAHPGSLGLSRPRDSPATGCAPADSGACPSSSRPHGGARPGRDAGTHAGRPHRGREWQQSL